MFFSTGKLVFDTKQPTIVHAIAVFDINGDGYLDVIAGRSYYAPPRDKGIPLEVMLGTKSGVFKQGASVVVGGIPAPVSPHRPLVADFNGDGKSDLLIANSGMDADPFPGSRPTLLLSSGKKLVNADANLPNVKSFAHGAAAADIDMDGDIDVFIAAVNSATNVGPHFLMNDGTGHFSYDNGRIPAFYSNLNQSVWPSSLLADFDGDGDPDLWLGANNFDIDNAILANDGSGNFTHASGVRPHETSSIYAMYTVAIDINRDGLVDVIQGEGEIGFNGAGGKREIGIYVNKGGLTFANETKARLFGLDREGDKSWQHMSKVHIADFNKDGAPDILMQPNGDKLQVFINNGDGIFFRPVDGSFRLHGGNLIVADFNKDGRPDILETAQEPSSDFYLHLNKDGPKMTFTGGSKGDKLFGNAKGNTISGEGGNDYIRSGAGKDTLIGGAGKDSLLGGSGADKFIFDARLGKGNVDRVDDFQPGKDKLLLDSDVFKGLSKGGLNAAKFHSGAGETTAHDRSDRIIYDTLSGKLYFDGDGTKAGKDPIHFATLKGAPLIDAGDFGIV